MVALALLTAALVAGAAEPEIGLWLGRTAEDQEIDVVRLNYRLPLTGDERPWWWPQHLQLGAGIWRVPDFGGPTQRYDVSATPVWRRQNVRGYFEGGIGVYLLSRTINNEITSLPTSFQFGSHVGAGLILEKSSIGVAFQHLSNAGLKQPNGGVNFYMVTMSLAH